MSSTQIYQVPVVSNGLREPESLLQIVDALASLDNVFNNVYTSISSRVSKEKSRIDNVSNRLSRAQCKVDSIVGSRNAITVFSSARYPSSNQWTDYSPLYSDKARVPFNPSSSNYQLNDVVATRQQQQQQDSQEVLGEHVVFIEKSMKGLAKNEELEKEGLGQLPQHISSVSNLLLFNTQENPYKKYPNSLDNMKDGMDNTNQGRGHQVLLHGRRRLQAPPVSVEKGESIVQTKSGWIPQMSINLSDLQQNVFPTSLPLDHVAENINWNNQEEQQTIAPSNIIYSSLPIFVTDDTPSVDVNQIPDVTRASGIAPVVQQPQQLPPSGLPPLPPPQPQQTLPILSVIATQQLVPPAPPGPITAPPAPPTPSAPITRQSPVSTVHQADDDNIGKRVPTPHGQSTGTGDLLADLQRDHMARLKKFVPEEEKPRAVNDFAAIFRDRLQERWEAMKPDDSDPEDESDDTAWIDD
ncbi:hypothetical protein SAMD00019534_006270 [Acytostelium subglobosum LB1]|uniref:hypothetical protein n=1 Tax=Acytostelium subglobosum LB1 TaxID=1410327 RepID=UPI0006450052|nr:hypothetical protein SAMD00019534_006270 [Acytostelium subglobosum LB1]GAM17452.1 hypothetical protein SAMD00019534_006270 [Acytostelium subglobosum LB1]|eukprot:XP_012759514.1 hypothetical protein SAMD00019534_006270 [Acytostelium subglobosum LB1]